MKTGKEKTRSLSKRQKKTKEEKSKRDIESLALGQATTYAFSYDPSLLESFENKNSGEWPSWVNLICPEFTSLCPKTRQPDFGKIIINYVPAFWMVESKSLKLYLFSFRNHGSFHEDCVQTICDDLVRLLAPRFLEVRGVFNPRGGISINPYSSYANGEEEFEILRGQRFTFYTEEH